MKRLCLAILFGAVGAFVPGAAAAEFDVALFKDHDAAFVLRDLSTGEVQRHNPEECALPEPPCSTFKIYHTLIGLELGLIKAADEPWYQWDKVERAVPDWNQDLTLREAFRVSAVPAYKELARKVGEEQMKSFLKKLRYGNEDISSGLDQFWLGGEGSPLKISADRQVELLEELLTDELPFSPENVEIVRDVMRADEAGVLHGKTGTKFEGETVTLGWYIGYVEKEGQISVFACKIKGGEKPSGLKARAIAENVLKSKGLL